MILPVFSTRSESTRLDGIRLLDDGSEHCVCDLMRTLGATQSRVSRHMQALKQIGLVVDRRDAQWVRCRINPDLPLNIRALLDAARTEDLTA
jgi:ArsR family transcriptional regulator